MEGPFTTCFLLFFEVQDKDQDEAKFKMSDGMGVINCAANKGDKNLAIMTVKGIGGRMNKITVTRLDVMCVCSVKKGLDHVGRTRMAKSCGSRDDTLSWNLSRVKQGGAIRADGRDHKTERARRAVCHILASAR